MDLIVNASLFVVIVLTFLCLLLGYLVLGRVQLAARAVGLRRSTFLRPAAPPTSRLPSDRASALQPEQARWTALDDEQLARFVRDSSR